MSFLKSRLLNLKQLFFFLLYFSLSFLFCFYFFVCLFVSTLQITTNGDPALTKTVTGKSLLGKRLAKAELHAVVNEAMLII